jgi:antitoxin HicB
MKNQNIGSNFDDFLKEDGMLEEVTAVAVKRVIAWQIEQEMAVQKSQRRRWQKRCTPAVLRLIACWTKTIPA